MNATGITSMRTIVRPIDYQREIALALVDRAEIEAMHRHTPRSMAVDQRNLREVPSHGSTASFGTSLADALATIVPSGGAS